MNRKLRNILIKIRELNRKPPSHHPLRKIQVGSNLKYKGVLKRGPTKSQGFSAGLNNS